MSIQSLSYRALAIISVLLCAGCKVVVLSHNVGAVKSESGVRDCPAGELCVFDVVDIYFRDRFQAHGIHPNYRFSKWTNGNRALCGGMEKPCTLTTENFADFPGLMKILESDERFVLIPKFERVGPVETAQLEFRESDDRRVYDANGRVVGTYEAEPGSWFGEGINVYFEGMASHYMIPIEYTGLNFRVSNFREDLVYPSGDCEGEPLPSLILPDEPFPNGRSAHAPLPVIAGPGAGFYIVDPIGEASQSEWTSRWDSSERECLPEAGSSGNTVPLIPTSIEFDYPLTVEGENTTIVGPWPDSLVI